MGLQFLVVKPAHADTRAVYGCADVFSLHNLVFTGPLQPPLGSHWLQGHLLDPWSL